MTDTPETASEALKRVLAAKKGNAPAHAGMSGGKSEERAVAFTQVAQVVNSTKVLLRSS